MGLVPFEKFKAVPGAMENEYFKLVKGENNHWLAVDKKSQLTIEWEDKKFNETQKVSSLKEMLPEHYEKYLKILQYITDWLAKNHRDKI